MRYSVPILLILGVLIISCAEKSNVENIHAPISTNTLVEIPDNTVDKFLLQYDNKTSIWTLNSQLFSGYAVAYYENGVLEEKTGFLNGKKQSQAIFWFPTGHLKRILNYHKGKLHGVKKSWSDNENHVLVSHLNYYMGKAHGEQRLWYDTGELYKRLNLNMGVEEGIQQAFRKNGDLYANYEAKEGRIFGLKKSQLCYGLQDEKIDYAK